MKRWLLVFINLIILIYSVTPAKILGFFPLPVKSHNNAFFPILNALADQGHDVTYITPVEPSIKSPHIKIILMRNFLQKLLDLFDLATADSRPTLQFIHDMYRVMYECREDLYGGPEVQDIINSNETYDAVLMESVFAQEATSALIHKFGCIGIEIITTGDHSWANELAGVPDNPAFQIDLKSPYIDHMGFWERLHNTYITTATTVMSYLHMASQQETMDEYFRYPGWETRPPLAQMASNRSLLLINADHILSYPYPLAPHAKLVGGINVLPTKPLPSDLQKFMDEATEGVILFSMGSNLKTSELVSSPMGQAFLRTFSKLKQKVLMKWESDEVPKELPKNLITMSWLPQQDILAHNNCIIFITHGGFLSNVEAAYHGVPIIGIPIFGDQAKNIHLTEKAGYGVFLDRTNISEISLNWAIQEILIHPRYQKEATKISKMFKERRHTSLEEAVYWIEYVIKYPNSLTPASAYMSFIEMHLIDVKLFISFIFIIISYIIYKMCYIIFRQFLKYLCTHKMKTKQKMS